MLFLNSMEDLILTMGLRWLTCRLSFLFIYVEQSPTIILQKVGQPGTYEITITGLEGVPLPTGGAYELCILTSLVPRVLLRVPFCCFHFFCASQPMFYSIILRQVRIGNNLVNWDSTWLGLYTYLSSNNALGT